MLHSYEERLTNKAPSRPYPQVNAVWDVFPVVPKLCMKPHPAPQCSYVPFHSSCCKHPAPCHGK